MRSIEMYRNKALSILGFGHNENPDIKALKKAFVIKARESHPDKIKYPANTTEEQRQAIQAEGHAAFIAIKKAYDFLCMPLEQQINQAQADDVEDDGEYDIHALYRRMQGLGLCDREFIDTSSKNRNLNRVHLKWMHFSNDEDYDIGFQVLKSTRDNEFVFKSMIIDENLGMQSLQEILANGFSVSISLMDKESLDALKKNGFVESIVQEIEKNKSVIRIDVPENFFDEQQSNRIKECVKRNKSIKNKFKYHFYNMVYTLESLDFIEKLTRFAMTEGKDKYFLGSYKYGFFYSLLLAGIITSGLFALVGLLPSVILSFVMAQPFDYSLLTMALVPLSMTLLGITAVPNLIRDIKKMISKYYTLDNISINALPEEQSALKAGCEATTWRGYFSSFLQLPTYKHPLAFRAGMQLRMDGQESSCRHINQLSPEKRHTI